MLSNVFKKEFLWDVKMTNYWKNVHSDLITLKKEEEPTLKEKVWSNLRYKLYNITCSIWDIGDTRLTKLQITLHPSCTCGELQTVKHVLMCEVKMKEVMMKSFETGYKLVTLAYDSLNWLFAFFFIHVHTCLSLLTNCLCAYASKYGITTYQKNIIIFLLSWWIYEFLLFLWWHFYNLFVFIVHWKKYWLIHIYKMQWVSHTCTQIAIM